MLWNDNLPGKMRQIHSLFQLLVSFSRAESFLGNTVLEINPSWCHKGLWLQPTRHLFNSVCFLSPSKHKEDATKRLWIGVLQEAANSGLNKKFSYFTGIISCPNLVHWMGTWNENMRNVTFEDITHQFHDMRHFGTGDSALPLLCYANESMNTFHPPQGHLQRFTS